VNHRGFIGHFWIDPGALRPVDQGLREEG
jgi:hypothetical protein